MVPPALLELAALLGRERDRRWRKAGDGNAALPRVVNRLRHRAGHRGERPAGGGAPDRRRRRTDVVQKVRRRGRPRHQLGVHRSAHPSHRPAAPRAALRVECAARRLLLLEASELERLGTKAICRRAQLPQRETRERKRESISCRRDGEDRVVYLCALGRRELAARCCGLKKSGRKLRMHEIAGGEMRAAQVRVSGVTWSCDRVAHRGEFPSTRGMPPRPDEVDGRDRSKSKAAIGAPPSIGEQGGKQTAGSASVDALSETAFVLSVQVKFEMGPGVTVSS